MEETEAFCRLIAPQVRRDRRAAEVGAARRCDGEHGIVLRHPRRKPEVELLEAFDGLCCDALGFLDDERVARDVLCHALCVVSVELRRREVRRARDDDFIIPHGCDGACTAPRTRIAGIDDVLVGAAADVDGILLCQRRRRCAAGNGRAAEDILIGAADEVYCILACRGCTCCIYGSCLGLAAGDLLPRGSGGEGHRVL